MLKKRILASSLASVMALSSVSVVAFADETATAEYGEVVTRPELKEHLKTYDKLISGDINNYGSVQALRFQEAYDHAAYVAADADADEADIIAAYQMVKAVYATLQQYTSEQLQELIDENKSTYETNNILNVEILDNIYEETAWLAFKAAYEDAEVIVDVDDLMMVTDAYITLSEAADTLETKRLTPVSKSDYRNVIREYENMLAQFSKNEKWRRGTVSVDPTTGGTTLDLSDAVYVTWGQLQNIVQGASDAAVVTAVTPRTTTTAGTDTTMAPTSSTWIKVSTDVETLIYNRSKEFDSYKSAAKTTSEAIKEGYDAAKEAIAVFKSWKAIDADATVKSEATKTLNKYRIQLANDFEKTLINSLVETDSSKFGGYLTIANGTTAALVYDGKTLKGNTGVNDKECYLRIDSGTGLIQLASDGTYKYDEGATKSYTIRIAEGVDYMRYIPVRAANVKVDAANGFTTDSTEKKIEKVQDALFMLEKYTATAANSAATADDWKTAYGAEQTNNSATVADSVKELDENTTITKPSGSSREYTLINRYLTYALTDLYPAEATACKHTKAEIKALIAKAYDLIDKTGNSYIFAVENKALADARRDAVEWVREAEKDKLYKDNDEGHGKFTAGAINDQNATYVYHTLSCSGGVDTYDALDAKLKKYPISYGEIVEKIADVNEKVENDVYGEAVKKAVDEVAYCLSVLKASDPGNEAFTDERALNAYNRLRSDITSATIDATEVALVKALEALDKTIEEGATAEVVKGDADGDGKVTINDALRALKASVGSVTLSESEMKAADVDGVPGVTALDALAILKMAL